MCKVLSANNPIINLFIELIDGQSAEYILMDLDIDIAVNIPTPIIGKF